jgi:hypothetical protein
MGIKMSTAVPKGRRWLLKTEKGRFCMSWTLDKKEGHRKIANMQITGAHENSWGRQKCPNMGMNYGQKG